MWLISSPARVTRPAKKTPMGKSNGKIFGRDKDLDEVEIQKLADGLYLGDQPLEAPRLVKTGWKAGQIFELADDPDRMQSFRWEAPSFIERKDPMIQRQKTSVEELDVPKTGPTHWARIVRGVFDEDDCAELISCINRKGFTPALLNIGGGRQALEPSARNGHRAIVESLEMSRWLLEVIRPYLPETFQRGTLIDLNERCRVLCYTPGQEFPSHYDGCFHRSAPDPRAGDRSMITVQVYLHDVPAGSGGETTFMRERRGREEAAVSCQPCAGSVLIFTQNLLHEGSLLKKGLKYTLRTEAMYRM